MINVWKWSIGETYYRSARARLQKEESQTQNQAIQQSLAEESFFNQDADLINITNTVFSRNQNASGTRREDLDLKIADREMIAQRGVNPFLQTSYVNDVAAQDMFMKPKNTTFGRTDEELNDKI
jgi:hypothetical protein